MTIDNTATTWRDLADQLTTEQVDRFATLESNSRVSAEETASSLLEVARATANANVANRVIFGDLDSPPDARRIYAIGDDADDDGEWTRSFDGTERKVDRASVCITGEQHPDGRIVRTVLIEARDDYDAATARRIAAALIEAADEIERLA